MADKQFKTCNLGKQSEKGMIIGSAYMLQNQKENIMRTCTLIKYAIIKKHVICFKNNRKTFIGILL
jgi:hypothetical protein